jgi:hypothetical protein
MSNIFDQFKILLNHDHLKGSSETKNKIVEFRDNLIKYSQNGSEKDLDELRRATKKISLDLHPDKKTGNQECFQALGDVMESFKSLGLNDSGKTEYERQTAKAELRTQLDVHNIGNSASNQRPASFSFQREPSSQTNFTDQTRESGYTNQTNTGKSGTNPWGGFFSQEQNNSTEGLSSNDLKKILQEIIFGRYSQDFRPNQNHSQNTPSGFYNSRPSPSEPADTFSQDYNSYRSSRGSSGFYNSRPRPSEPADTFAPSGKNNQTSHYKPSESNYPRSNYYESGNTFAQGPKNNDNPQNKSSDSRNSDTVKINDLSLGEFNKNDSFRYKINNERTWGSNSNQRTRS